MIERVALANFKAIGPRLELRLAPLTILVGENAVGKSSVLEAIALLVQSTRPSGRVGLVADGPLVDLGGDIEGA